MTKDELAGQLRIRVVERNAFTRTEQRRIAHLSADAIIDSYIICSGCGHKQVEGAALAALIEKVNSATDFVAYLDGQKIH